MDVARHDPAGATQIMGRAFAILVLAGASVLLAGLGLGPLIMTLLRDLIPALALPVLVYPIVAIVGAVVIAGAWIKPGDWTSSAPADRGQVAQIFLITLALSVFASLFIAWESDNLFSWRMAMLAESPEQISLNRLERRGTHAVELRPVEDLQRGQIIVDSPLPEHLRLSGGHVRVSLRVQDDTELATTGSCIQANPDGTSAEYRSGQVVELAVRTANDCARWTEVEVGIEPGVSSLSFMAAEPISAGTKIDLVFQESSVAFRILWWLASVIATALIVTGAICMLAAANKQAEKSRPRAESKINWRRSDTFWSVIAVTVFILVANSGVYAFVSSERTIYTWDFGGHWMSAISVSEALTGKSEGVHPDTIKFEEEHPARQFLTTPSTSPFGNPGMLATLVRNVRYAEYNVTAGIPVGIPMTLFGPSRLVYELSLVNVFGVGSLAALLLTVWHFLSRGAKRIPRAWPLVPVLVILGFSQFWVPLVRGYLGSVVVVLNLILIWLYFRRSIDSQTIVNCVLIGVILALSIIIRRWNAVWAVAFATMMLIDAIWHFYQSRRFDWSGVVNSFRVILLVGSSAFLALAVLAWPLVITMTVTDYSDIYSAYASETTSFLGHANYFVWTFGLGIIFLTTLAAVFLLTTDEYRRTTALLIIQLGCSIVYFSSIQEMGPHHMYILMPPAFLVLCLAMLELLARRVRIGKMAGVAALSLYVTNGIASNAAVFVPRAEGAYSLLRPIVPGNRRLPLVRDDLDEITRLAEYLDRRISETGPVNGIYVLSSSTIFNVAHLRMLGASTGHEFKSTDLLLPVSAVDKRDGFPRGLITADIVIVGTPPQFNVPPEDQNVIAIPAQMMAANEGIGPAFERLPSEFSLDEGVSLLVFRRVRANTAAEIAELSRGLRELYPKRPYIYRY